MANKPDAAQATRQQPRALVVDIKGAAIMLGRSVDGVRHLVKTGVLPVTHITAGKLQFSIATIENLVRISEHREHGA